MNSTSLDLNASETLANKTLVVTTILVNNLSEMKLLVGGVSSHVVISSLTGKPVRDAEVQLPGVSG